MHQLPFFLRQWLAAAALLLAAREACALSVVAPTFDELVASAEVVVRGVVTDVRCAPLDTPQGPAIETLVTLRVERTLKGRAGEKVTLSLLGGTIGRRTLRILGMPTFNVGDRHIVFVAGNGHVVCPLVSAGHGRYRVVRDPGTGRDHVLRDDRTPLTSTADVVRSLEEDHDAPPETPAPASAMPVEDFEAQVIAAIRGSGKGLQP